MKYVLIIPLLCFAPLFIYFGFTNLDHEQESSITSIERTPLISKLIEIDPDNYNVCSKKDGPRKTCIEITQGMEHGVNFVTTTPYIDGKIEGVEKKYILQRDHDMILTSDTTYVNNQKNGSHKNYSITGKIIYSVVYKNDLKEGMEFFFFDNSRIRLKVNYKEGKKNGKMVAYSESGQIQQEGSYVDDLEDGYFKTYNHKGALSTINHFKRGKLEDLGVRYYPSGKLRSTIPFKNDLAHGMATTYFANGIVASRTPMQYGKRHGEQCLYYPNNKIKQRSMYNQGNLTQPIVNYTSDGRIHSTVEAYRLDGITYRNGTTTYYKYGQPYIEVVFEDDLPVSGKCSLDENRRALNTQEVYDLGIGGVIPDCKEPLELM